MTHSIDDIAEEREKLSKSRGDKNQFVADGFKVFAENNKHKYHLIESDGKLFVKTWYADSLINDYIKSINGVN